MSIDKHKPVRARSQSFRSLKDQSINRSKTNLQIPLIFSFEKDLPDSNRGDMGNKIRSSSSSAKVDTITKSTISAGNIRQHTLSKKNAADYKNTNDKENNSNNSNNYSNKKFDKNFDTDYENNNRNFNYKPATTKAEVAANILKSRRP